MSILEARCDVEGRCYFGVYEVRWNGGEEIVVVRYNGDEKVAHTHGHPSPKIAETLLVELVTRRDSLPVGTAPAVSHAAE